MLGPRQFQIRNARDVEEEYNAEWLENWAQQLAELTVDKAENDAFI